MTDITQKRIDAVMNGECPDGYTKKWHILPLDWKDVPLLTLLEKSTRKNSSKAISLVLTNSAAYGLIPQTEYFEKDIANSENIDHYLIVEEEDYVYNPRVSDNAPYGPFCRNHTGKTGIVSPLYTVLKPYAPYDDSPFIEYYLESPLWFKYAYSVGSFGARFDRMNISDKDLMQLPIAFPPQKERQKIAEILSQCDKVISLYQAELEEVKHLKWACLQMMFPKAGEVYPKCRFPGFTAAWEQRKLGEISESYSGGTPTVGIKEYYGGKIPFIRSAEINNDVTEIFITEKGLKNSSARLVSVGDILYALYGATSGEVGRAKLIGAINQAILVIKPHDEYDAEFLVQWLRKSKRNIIETYLQGGQGNLSGAIVKELLVEFPSLQEQQRIGSYFHFLDNLIALHQSKLNAMQQKKKALMQLLLTGIVRVRT